MTVSIAHLGLLDDEDIHLDIAALELSALDHEGVALGPYFELLDGFEADLRALAPGVVSATEQAELLASILADRYGFVGDDTAYDAPLNADMIRVLDRRRGLPVSLSILYVALARRIGWMAEALNTPGHVLVCVGPSDAAVVIDPFSGGSLVTRDALTNLLRLAFGPEVVFDHQHLAPMSNRTVLVRLLLNQAMRAEQAGDTDRALIVYERMVDVAPSNAQGWWDLARLQLAAGRVENARISLSSMLETTRDSDTRARIVSALEALAGR